MSRAVKLSDQIVLKAQQVSKVFNRSVAGQVEYWAKIGQIAEENPDLTYNFIKNILLGKEQSSAGRLKSYPFEDKARGCEKI